MSFPGASARQRQLRRGATAWIAAVALGSSLTFGNLIAPLGDAYAATPTDLTGIILQVGANESQRIISWYSSTDTQQEVQLAPASQVVNGQFPSNPVTFSATGTANTAKDPTNPNAPITYNRHATLSALTENTAYTYRVGFAGNWSSAYTFKTQSFNGNFDFLFFGDPQIGSSGNVPLDQQGWQSTLDVALTANPNAEILVSGGDQVEVANIENQWTSYLAPDQLRQYPTAATIGNHDVGGRAYDQHFYTPNTDQSAKFYANGNPASDTSGGDYWYIYKDVLFIDLNSNSYTTSTGGGGDAAHIQFVTDTINAHGAEAKYKVLVYHHAIYSAAAHAKDPDNKARRLDFPTTFSNLGVNLVLQGHDHSYSRSYEIKNSQKAVPGEQPAQGEVFQGPGGVIYVTANSASGSKYYDITAPDNSGTSGAGNGADPLNPSSYWYNSVQNQEHVRSYVKVQVQTDALTVQNLRSGTCDTANDPNPALQQGNVKWCGPNNGSGTVQPIGSVVDEVTIHPNHGAGQDIQVNVPNVPGEFAWTIDGRNSLVDLGTAQDQGGQYLQATGQINPIAVTDTRRSAAAWAVNSSLGNFQDGTDTFPGSYLGWTPKVVTPGAGARAGASVLSGYDQGTGLATSRVLGSADQGHPRGQAKLGAQLNLKIPASVNPGSYRATLTITALSS